MDFRRSLAISAVFHITLILATSFHLILPRPKYIVVPVDLMYYSPPATLPSEESKKEEVAIPPPVAFKKKPVPRKEKTKKTEEEKKKQQTAKAAESQAKSFSPPLATQPEASSSITPDTAKFPYLYYLRKVREEISRNWGWGSSGGENDGAQAGILKSVVYFRILKDGTITPPVLKEKSGDSVFDAVALRSVSVSAPFPPLPSGYDEESLGVYFEFSYKE